MDISFTITFIAIVYLGIIGVTLGGLIWAELQDGRDERAYQASHPASATLDSIASSRT